MYVKRHTIIISLLLDIASKIALSAPHPSYVQCTDAELGTLLTSLAAVSAEQLDPVQVSPQTP